MNKQELASRIWKSANRMRSKIEANEYKDYILGFIFYKFLSEEQVARLRRDGLDDLTALTEDDVEIVEYTRDLCGYFISYENLFGTWLAKGNDFGIDNVRDALSAFSRNIDPARKKVFNGIFDTLQSGLSKLGTDARAQSKAARDLIYLIQDIPMGGKQDYDVLGFIYEYLISNFAANAGKKAGEFYTPHEVSLLMSEIVAWHLRDRENIEIYDPTSGSGSLLINIGAAVARRNGSKDNIKFFAQELKQNTYNLTRMNLVMRGILPDNIEVRNGDTLDADWPWFESEENKEETYNPLFVDAVVSNPPYSQQWEPEDKELDPRFANYGVAPKSKADYAFLLHDLFHLKPDGIMTIILPHGVLFRGGEEGKIRQNLLERGHVQAVIGLPANIFYGTGIPTIIMVLRKARTERDVLIVDASKNFVKAGKQNVLRASDIQRITDTVAGCREVDKFSRLVSLEEIRANDYNLNIPRYVDSSEPAEPWNLHALLFGGIPADELGRLSPFWEAWPGLQEKLFDVSGDAIAARDVDVEEVVSNDDAVAAFRSGFGQAVGSFPAHIKKRLIDARMGVNALAEQGMFAALLEESLDGIPLIDYYDAFQVLDEAWDEMGQDLEIIQTEGDSAITAVAPNMVVRKKNGKEVEVQEGFVGRILPFELIQRRLLSDELGELEDLKRRAAEAGEELTALFEGLPEDAPDDLLNEAKTAFARKGVVDYLKGVGVKPRAVPEDFPEESTERIALQAKSLLESKSGLDRDVKAASRKLEDDTKERLEGLSVEEGLVFLHDKWSSPLMEGLAGLAEAKVAECVAAVRALAKKYESTFADVSQEIADTERELSALLGDLTGSDADMEAIGELERLLGGE
ncbi:type I restriction-modification system subunit M [Trueperella bernardiae]|uniref:type I restriction-modification system subunit M n=1 Tax=Trueperella bernardiae TaxID=59561 RepID=UPI0025537DF6|nr:type I restriction-modification system subunit M [Trueperella bernardiae]WIM08878.1 type I restriction-modification system subunit M [Trueperella bernardiae]